MISSNNQPQEEDSTRKKSEIGDKDPPDRIKLQAPNAPPSKNQKSKK
jgi:hypothetical protein